MKNKVWYKIDSDSKAIDILRDRDFLRLLRIFILEFEPNIQDNKLLNLKEQFSSKSFLSDFNDKNNYNLFKQIIGFLSDDFVKPIFFEYLEKYNLDQKYLNLFLEVGDFLEKTYVDSTEYPEWFYNVSDKYKTKITDILWKNELTDLQYQLLQIWYPLISPFSSAIIDVDIDNLFTKKSILWGEDIYIYCRDEKNNVFYMNYLWEILKDSEDKIIKDIKIKEVKTFWWFNVFKFINEDNENKVWIISSVWIWKISEIEADNFNVKNISFIEEALDENGEIIEVEEKLDYLLINSWEEKKLLNNTLEEISILDLLLFLHKNNLLTKKNIKETLDRLSELSVEEIYKLYQFNWVKFIELSAELPIWYDEYWDQIYENNHVVLLDNWKPLSDNNEFGTAYIYSLWELKEFLDKQLVSFSLTQMWGIDWYIDSFWKIVKIRNERLVYIEKIFTYKNKNYFRINNKNDFILSEEELFRELDLYDGFNESDNKIEIWVDSWEYIDINKKSYEKIVVDLWKDNLKIYLQRWKNRELIDYKDLIINLKKTENWRKVLSMLNKTLVLFENN